MTEYNMVFTQDELRVKIKQVFLDAFLLGMVEGAKTTKNQLKKTLGVVGQTETEKLAIDYYQEWKIKEN